MKCEKMTEYIPQLINGTINHTAEKEVLNHLMECEECRAELAFWTQIADAAPNYEKEFSSETKKSIYTKLAGIKLSAYELVKDSFKIYFKVIKIMTNL